MNKNVASLSDFIASKAPMEATTYPIDRHFLEPYIEEILKFDRKEFIVYNFENTSNLYAQYLMLCLPELWDNTTVDDLVDILNKFTKTSSFNGLTLFTYKFVEIDITKIIFSLETLPDGTKINLRNYLKTQYPNLLKTDTDFLFFEEGLYGVDNDRWMYVKRKLISDPRLSPAMSSLEEIEEDFR